MSAVIVGSIIGAMLGAFANGMSPLLYIRTYSIFFSRAVLLGLFFGSIISYVFISLVRCGNFGCFAGFSPPPACDSGTSWRVTGTQGGACAQMQDRGAPVFIAACPGIFTGKQSICDT